MLCQPLASLSFSAIPISQSKATQSKDEDMDNKKPKDSAVLSLFLVPSFLGNKSKLVRGKSNKRLIISYLSRVFPTDEFQSNYLENII